MIWFHSLLFVGPPFNVNLSIFAPASFAIFTFELQSKATPSITDLIKWALEVVGLIPKNIPEADEFQFGDKVFPKYGKYIKPSEPGLICCACFVKSSNTFKFFSFAICISNSAKLFLYQFKDAPTNAIGPSNIVIPGITDVHFNILNSLILWDVGIMTPMFAPVPIE